MDKWLDGIHVWWMTHPTTEDIANGLAKDPTDWVRQERTLSIWAKSIESITTKVVQEIDEDGKVKNVVSYNIAIAGFKHSFSISSATYLQLKPILEGLN